MKYNYSTRPKAPTMSVTFDILNKLGVLYTKQSNESLGGTKTAY